MNQTTSPEFDPRIADWLEQDPDRAPGAVLETVLAALPSIPQRRAVRAPWRLPTMTRFAPIGAAAAITVVLVGGAILFLRPGGGGVGTSPIASPSPSSPPPSPTAAPSIASGTGACSLVTSDEAESQAGIVGLGALPTETGAGDETTCIYRDGGGNILLRVTYSTTGGASDFETIRAIPDVEAVADIGDAAVFDPATSTLTFVQGDSLVAIVAGTSSDSPEKRLTIERSVAELAAERVTPTQ